MFGEREIKAGLIFVGTSLAMALAPDQVQAQDSGRLNVTMQCYPDYLGINYPYLVVKQGNYLSYSPVDPSKEHEISPELLSTIFTSPIDPKFPPGSFGSFTIPPNPCIQDV